jgi:hypothetical protein
MRHSLPPITVVVLALALTIGFFPISLALGIIDTFWSARAAAGPVAGIADAAVCLVLCVFFVLTVLVWPMGFAGYLHPESPWPRVLVAGTLWCLPAVGFGYFVGEYINGLQIYDYLIAIVVPVTSAVVFYRRTQKWVETALFLSLALFFGIFVIGDILGPFPTFVRFASGAVASYALRTIFSFAVLALVALAPIRFSLESTVEEAQNSWFAAEFGSEWPSPARLILGTALLGFLVSGLRMILDELSLLSSDLAPLAMLLVAWVLLKSERFSKRVIVWLAAAQLLALGVPMVRSFSASRANLWTQLQLGYQTLALCVFIWLLAWAWMALRAQSVHHARESGRFS